MTEVLRDAVRIPGATLHYESTGSGPVLLLIHGGIADSAMLKGFAALLADRYTVVTYDRRGYGDSPVDDPDQEQNVELHADDAHRLLAAITDEPADMYTVSSGGFVALDLAVRHPEQVRTVVAFEPPVSELLPDREAIRAQGDGVYEAYRGGGVPAAMGAFTRMVLGDDAAAQQQQPPPGEPTAEMREAMARMGRNAEFFFRHEFRQFGAWTPDFEALRAAPVRTLIAAGAASGDQSARRAAEVVAERLGTELVEFPGHHGGIMTEPDAYATQLDRLLRG
jgi:pimeloyl-ACP methyl ester carboxylesterase